VEKVEEAVRGLQECLAILSQPTPRPARPEVASNELPENAPDEVIEEVPEDASGDVLALIASVAGGQPGATTFPGEAPAALPGESPEDWFAHAPEPYTRGVLSDAFGWAAARGRWQEDLAMRFKIHLYLQPAPDTAQEWLPILRQWFGALAGASGKTPPQWLAGQLDQAPDAAFPFLRHWMRWEMAAPAGGTPGKPAQPDPVAPPAEKIQPAVEPGKHPLPGDAVAENLLHDLPAFLERLRQAAPPAEEPVAAGEEEDEATDWRYEKYYWAGQENSDRKLYVSNAGLVLLWPFLPALFRRLGWVEGKDFVNGKVRARAVRLLQFVADGGEGQPEYELVFNKILCGMPLSKPFPRLAPLTAEEKEEVRQWLQAVFARWDKLAHATVGSFQQSFLQRPGVLLWQSGKWNLKVESRGYDIILRTLP
jgi:hypothetical protein